jgi:hypothetical protein
VVGLREDAAIIPAGSPALEGVSSRCYPTRCKEKGSKRTCNTPTVCPSHDAARLLCYQWVPTSIAWWRGHGQEAKRGEADG